jgi:hypothetical protein
VQPGVHEQAIVVFTFVADKVTEEVNESLTLQLVPTPATLQTIPMGEGVFFEREIILTITDADRAFIAYLFECPQDAGYPAVQCHAW